MGGDSLCTPFNSIAQVKWIGSPNHYNGRNGYEPTAIVIHTMGGTLVGTDAWFNNSASQVSAHYGISLHGEVHQYVALKDGAWANGILEQGNKWPYTDGVNPNYRTVSIETEDLGVASTQVSLRQAQATLQVCRTALQVYPTIVYLMAHRAISPKSRPNCPGTRWTLGPIQHLADQLGLELIL